MRQLLYILKIESRVRLKCDIFGTKSFQYTVIAIIIFIQLALVILTCSQSMQNLLTHLQKNLVRKLKYVPLCFDIIIFGKNKVPY